MIELKPVNFLEIQKYFVDFQKHSKCYEMPPEAAQCVGIYDGSRLAGYFIVLPYTDRSIDIIQGYWTKEYRHKDLSKTAVRLLEERIKRFGFTICRIVTHSRFRSYMNFAKDLGYSPSHIIFQKRLS